MPITRQGANPLSLDDANPLFQDDDSLATTLSKVLTLESFMTAIARDTSFKEFIRDILLTVQQSVKSEAGSILEFDHRNRTLFFRATVGQSADRVDHFVIPIGQGIVGHVAESRQAIVVNNVAENQIHLKSIQDAVGFPARNLVAIPILIRGRVFGVLELLNRIGEDSYTPEDLELLKYICSQASKAIEIRLMIAWALQKKSSSKDAA